MKKTSLRWRLVTAMITLALIPLLIMAYQGYHCARMAVVSAAQTHVKSVLALQMKSIEDWLSDVRSDLRMVTDLLDDTSMGEEPVRRVLTKFGVNRREYVDLVVLDSDLKFLLSTDMPENVKAHHMKDNFLQTLRVANQAVFSSIHHDPNDPSAMHVGTPFAHRSRRRFYLVVVLDTRRALRRILGGRQEFGAAGVTHVYSGSTDLVGSEEGVSKHLAFPARCCQFLPLARSRYWQSPPSVAYPHRG